MMKYFIFMNLIMNLLWCFVLRLQGFDYPTDLCLVLDTRPSLPPISLLCTSPHMTCMHVKCLLMIHSTHASINDFILKSILSNLLSYKCIDCFTIQPILVVLTWNSRSRLTQNERVPGGHNVHLIYRRMLILSPVRLRAFCLSKMK